MVLRTVQQLSLTVMNQLSKYSICLHLLKPRIYIIYTTVTATMAYILEYHMVLHVLQLISEADCQHSILERAMKCSDSVRTDCQLSTLTFSQSSRFSLTLTSINATFHGADTFALHRLRRYQSTFTVLNSWYAVFNL